MRIFMFIAKRLRLIVACSLAFAAFEAGSAGAHPVSQGALEVVGRDERVSVAARVSMEEVLVGAAYAGRKDLTALEMVRQHGDYLIAHLRLAADGRPLDGRVVKVPAEADGRPVYEIEYRIAGGAPARIAFEEDVLREFEFAPGNPWEASYVVRARRDGRLLVAFFFGLFHGLGFAGGLLSAMEGMAGLAVGLAIVAFSLGVEIGHQMVVLPIFGALKAARRAAPQAAQIPLRVLRYGSAGIFVAGLFYLVSALLEVMKA